MAIIKEEAGGQVVIPSGMLPQKLTHSALLKYGREWLRNKGCNPVFTEKGCGGGNEIPDVIGWTAGDCWVIECKTSIADYRADRKKDHRYKGGLGSRRYYLVPSALRDQIPNDTGWGLLVVENTSWGVGVRQVRGRGGDDFQRNLEHEVIFLRHRILDVQDYGLTRDIR